MLCLPVAVGLIIGQLHLGLLFSLVPACCNIAGLDIDTVKKMVLEEVGKLLENK